MNILYLCDEYPPGKHGGIGTVVQLLARQMVKRGHKVIVAGFYDLGYGGEDRFEDRGVVVYRFRSRLDGPWWHNRDFLPARAVHRLLNIVGLREWEIARSLHRYHSFLESLIREHGIEIVERPDYNDYLRSCRRPLVMAPLSVPSIIKLHGSISHLLSETGRSVPPQIWESEREMLLQADAIVSVSEYVARRTAARFGCDKPMKVLYNGIHTVVNTNGAAREPGLVVYTGSLAEGKGVYQLMKAWNLVSGRLASAKLKVFGRGRVDLVKAFLEQRAAGSVEFMGHVSRSDLFRNLAEASVAVFPSYAECFSMAPMEAMACSTPVIYTSRTSGPELITHGTDGLLVDPDDVAGLADRIVWVLQNPEKGCELARRGRERVTSSFDIDVIAGRHEEFYATLLPARKRSGSNNGHQVSVTEA